MVSGADGNTPAHTDPQGYYLTLGVPTDATAADITAAFRRRARLLHPDNPTTGDSDGFIALKVAYDLLSDSAQRAAYDRASRIVPHQAVDDPPPAVPIPPSMPEPPMRRPRFSDVPIWVWAALSLIVVFSAYQLILRLSTAPPERVVTRPLTSSPARTDRPAPVVATVPRRPDVLAGTPNHYTTPGPGPITVWRPEGETNRLQPIGQLQPFTPVQALRLFRQPGLMEIRLSDTTTGLIQAARLSPGGEPAAQRAFCIFHAGPAPLNAEVLAQRLVGTGSLHVVNREASPAIIKLRDRAGAAIVTFFVGPAEEARIGGLPDGQYRADYAYGEVWSRPCGGFAVGMRAWRFPRFQSLSALTPLVIPPDPADQYQPADLPFPAFSMD